MSVKIKGNILHTGLIEFIESCELPTEMANFHLYAFKENLSNKEHLAITLGKFFLNKPVLSRIHSQCLTGESLFSLRCDCRFQLTESLNKITKAGVGVIFYLQQEGRNIGLLNKVRAYKLQDQGLDTVEANHNLGFADDPRDYKIVSAMAQHLGINSINLMTNNPHKIQALEESGLTVNKRIPIKSNITKYNRDYLKTKANKLGHLL
jgi:GTP cyclohydrolase II